MSVVPAWVARLSDELSGAAGAGPGWGYRRGASPASEPTALAGLALLSAGARSRAAEAAAWLADAQRLDGSLPSFDTRDAPGWPTAPALLLWNALGSHPQNRGRAAGWLVALKGTTANPADDPGRIAGHDTTLVGWPWVADTHSWLEPTALAVLALDGEPEEEARARVAEGRRLVRDRAVASGGWNYGNKAVFGRPLRAQPAPTGLGLLALAGAGPLDNTVRTAIDYLLRALPATRAAISLGWGLLGLRAWGVEPAEANTWLAESYSAVAGRADAGPRLACLLLAASDNSLPILRGPRRQGAN